MSFYDSISEPYNQIFPLNPGQLAFVNRILPQARDLSVLDVGCGTGLLSQALAASFKKVVGIDLDEAMLAQARKNADPSANLSYFRLDMLEMDKQFPPGSFDCLICFGNTLVHLPSQERVSVFFRKSMDLLRPKGKILLQVIHYDRILDQHIKALPTIENSNIQFIRNYNYLEKEHLIEFETRLTIKETGQVLANKVLLYPLRQSEIESGLKKAGFNNIHFYGNFEGDPLTSASIPLVVEANKA